MTNNSNCLRLPLTTWSTFYSMSSTRLSSKLLRMFAFSLFSPICIFNFRHDIECRWTNLPISPIIYVFIFLQLLANLKILFASISFSTISQYKRYFCKCYLFNYWFNVDAPFASIPFQLLIQCLLNQYVLFPQVLLKDLYLILFGFP